ncbi:hypothetical protein IF188_09720 [Microbacterium sp. NEAU-LLC]|uniref:DUF7694 domain-containing protein n=1 Tax=Microbacterium helvum TaxID=2773713 RepID=A0ABR8NNF5_9MICO|nr:hypothetical protein [Microbacterium helvum]MBD3941972.1 hypothetical protein [Microbacterium helvum]
MREDLNILDVRRRLGRMVWGVPQPLILFGVDDGRTWRIDHLREPMRILISHDLYPFVDEADTAGGPWVHASISHRDRMPAYEELALLHRAVWGDTGWSYQLFAPMSDHVNIAEHALHLWGRPDGRKLLPNFGAGGTI